MKVLFLGYAKKRKTPRLDRLSGHWSPLGNNKCFFWYCKNWKLYFYRV